MNFLGKKFSYKKYQELAGKFAGTLDTIGLEDGSIIAIQLPNIPQYLFALFGSFLKGYKILADLIYSSKNKLKIKDIDINFKLRDFGKSKMNFGILLKLISFIIKRSINI